MVQIRNAGLAIFMMGSLYLPTKAQKQDASFTAYEQKIPNTTVSFRMVPVPAGSFLMGSPDKEKGRRADGGPATKVFVDSFWMEEHEVTYDEYVLFSDEERDQEPKPDGITRPSPPYVDGSMPAVRVPIPLIHLEKINSSLVNMPGMQPIVITGIMR